MSTPPADEPLNPPSPVEPVEAVPLAAIDPTRSIDATPFATAQIGSASAPPLLRADAAELIAIVDAESPIAPAASAASLVSTEPAVDAPLAVAGGGGSATIAPAVVLPAAERVAPAERIAPIVVKTRTGPVALEAQPPAAIVARPAPIAIRETVAAPALLPKPARLASLDIFRGITIAMMVLVNNEGVGHAYVALDHAEWHGWTPTDLVFPFFLFIVGVATPFSLGKRAAFDGTTRGTLFGHIWLRALSLMLLGWLLSGAYSPLPTAGWPETGFWFTKIFRAIGFPYAMISIFALLMPWWPKRVATWLPIVIAVPLVGYCIAMHFVCTNALAHGWDPDAFGGGFANPDRFRIPGVLVRIGICYGFAASLALFAGRKTAWLAILVLFTVYSCLMLGVRGPGQKKVGSLTPEDNFAHNIDAYVLQRGPVLADHRPAVDHAWREYVDNEGLVSTLPAIGTALIGVLVGWWLRRGDTTPAEKCAGLLARGVVVTGVGVLLGDWLMPINKNLWTPSFSVFTAGLAMLGLGSIFWIADVRQRRWWAWPFRVMGMNAIAAFVASSLVVRFAALFPMHHRWNPLKHKIDETMTVVSWLKYHAADGVIQASDWMHVHAAWAPTLNTPQNTSLAGALSFVCVIFVLMLALYVCRIFVKV